MGHQGAQPAVSKNGTAAQLTASASLPPAQSRVWRCARLRPSGRAESWPARGMLDGCPVGPDVAYSAGASVDRCPLGEDLGWAPAHGVRRRACAGPLGLPRGAMGLRAAMHRRSLPTRLFGRRAKSWTMTGALLPAGGEDRYGLHVRRCPARRALDGRSPVVYGVRRDGQGGAGVSACRGTGAGMSSGQPARAATWASSNAGSTPSSLRRRRRNSW